MKKLIAVTIVLLFTINVNAQVKGDTTIAKKGLCHTFKRQGIEIYILTDPVNEYDVTGKVDDEDITDVLNSISGTKTERTLTHSIDNLISNAIDKSKKKKHPFTFDAIISEDGSTGTCIKFK